MKKNKVLLNIVSVFCFIFGALYIFSLVFIPVGIYCFASGKLFSYKAEHLLDNYSADKKSMKKYVWFVSIACFPFGLLSIIAYLGVYGNNVKIDTLESHKIDDKETVSTNNVTAETKEDVVEETEEEKIEKLKKLRSFRDKNIITEEEFKMAEEQIFGKKDK